MVTCFTDGENTFKFFDLEIIARSCSTVGLEVGDDIVDSQGFGDLCISKAALIVAAVV